MCVSFGNVRFQQQISSNAPKTALPTSYNHPTGIYLCQPTTESTTRTFVAVARGHRHAEGRHPTTTGTPSSSSSSVVDCSVVASTTARVAAHVPNQQHHPHPHHKQILQFMTNASDTRITYEYTSQQPPQKNVTTNNNHYNSNNPTPTTRTSARSDVDVDVDANDHQYRDGLHVMHDCVQNSSSVFLSENIITLIRSFYYNLPPQFAHFTHDCFSNWSLRLFKCSFHNDSEY